MFSFSFRVSLISVCLVVVDGISAPAVKSEEVNSSRGEISETLTVRAEASCLKPAGSTVVCHAMADFVSGIRNNVACQNKYSRNICHASNRSPSRFLTSKKKE